MSLMKPGSAVTIEVRPHNFDRGRRTRDVRSAQ